MSDTVYLLWPHKHDAVIRRHTIGMGPERAQLELLSDRSMPGLERFKIGEWTLRCGLGATGRANSAWASGSAGHDIGDAVDRTESWYRARGAKAGFQIFDGGDRVFDDGGLRDELDRRAYVEADGGLVLVAEIPSISLRSESEAVSHIQSAKSATEDFASLIGNQNRVIEMSTTVLPQHYLTAFDTSGAVLGGGKSTLDGRWLGIFAMVTAEDARGRGVASTVMAELLTQGARRGAKLAWLQVMPGNEPARSLYEAMGFKQQHKYHYRFAPADS